MRRPVVAGNWKMHGSKVWIEAWLADWLGRVDATAELIVLPPAPYLSMVRAALADRSVRVGAQNVHAEAQGAFTGEVAAEMAKDAGADCTLVGHSERRQAFGETDDVVAAKFVAARRAGLTPILCIGESLDERKRGAAAAVVLRQLDAVIARAGVGAFEAALVAYEPVWAIGTGVVATPDDAQQMHERIRARLYESAPSVAAELRILYGGSVKSGNAAGLFSKPDVDGGLVGGASLDAKEFALICNAA